MDPLTEQLKVYNLEDPGARKRCAHDFFQNWGIQIRFSDHHLITRYQRWSDNFSPEHEIIPYSRGTILDIATLKPSSFSFKTRREYEDFSRDHDFSKVNIYKYYDGTMVNVYYNTYSNSWCYATKGRLDANQSKWHCERSFQELFQEICDLDLELLDKNYCYSFVLQHVDNKIVSNIEKNQVVLVLVRDLTSLKQVDLNTITNNQELCRNGNLVLPEHLNKEELNLDSFGDLESYVNDLDFNAAGVMLFSQDNPESHSRLMSMDYKLAEGVKGNCPNKKHHLVTLDNTEVDNYLYYYPEDTELYEKIEMLTRRLVASVFYYYQRVKVKKVYTEIPKHLRKLIYMIHQLYETRLTKMDTKQAAITHRVVKGYFHKLPVKYMLDLLDEHESFLENDTA